MKNDIATLSKNEKNYSVFQVGDLRIKFFTSPFLEKYCSIDKWKNNGYIEYTGKFSTFDEPVEDTIDLAYIADRLHISKDIFKNIKEVRLMENYEP